MIQFQFSNVVCASRKYRTNKQRARYQRITNKDGDKEFSVCNIVIICVNAIKEILEIEFRSLAPFGYITFPKMEMNCLFRELVQIAKL